MFHFGYITKEDIKEHNPKWPEISHHLHRILIFKVLDQEKQMPYLTSKS